MNEATALLKRTFEALYFHDVDYEHSADLVLWLETRGLPGIGALVDAFASLADQAKPQLTDDDPHRCRIDADGGSLFIVAASIIDVAMAQCAAEQHCHISIANAGEPLAMIPSVASCAQLDFAAAAAWYDETTNRLHRVRTLAGSNQPDYTILVPEVAPSWRHNDVELFVGIKNELVLERLADHSMFSEPGRHITEITADEFRQRFELCVDSGISLSDASYKALTAVANRVLVEATEESRHGAGE